MIIAGAGGHAVEILHIFDQLGQLGDLVFFDNTLKEEKKLFDRFRVICFEEVLNEQFIIDPRFVLGLGNPKYRQQLAVLLKSRGGVLASIVSPTASIGSFDVTLSPGLNIMTNVVIYNRVNIGEGTLLNTGCSIHHDVCIGDYCEICPGARILGGASVGDFSFIGTGAMVLPGITIGDDCVIGAGSVVNKNVNDGEKVVGVPARPSKG
jgi:sugar O-acyltransferase (sialic acid O-acetyltransferase NeuD family)